MIKVIPINAIRTTEKWLLDNGFQKLKTKEPGVFLFKNNELYIEYCGGETERNSWYRVEPKPDGTTLYMGTGNKGYAAGFISEVLFHFKNIHGFELTPKK